MWKKRKRTRLAKTLRKIEKIARREPPTMRVRDPLRGGPWLTYQTACWEVSVGIDRDCHGDREARVRVTTWFHFDHKVGLVETHSFKSVTSAVRMIRARLATPPPKVVVLR